MRGSRSLATTAVLAVWVLAVWVLAVWMAGAVAADELSADAPSAEAPTPEAPTPEAPTPEAQRREEMVRRIDQRLAERWQAAGVRPAELAADHEFLRRVYLDLTGVVPRVAEAREFLNDPSEEKRERLVDRLLESPAHATHLANTWRGFMLPANLDATQQANAVGVQRWLRSQFADNLRYDRLVGDLLVATGGGDTGPALFYTALEVKPEKLAGATARIFLGLQMDCAQCHDHPFDRWTQRDFWGYAAFFARLRQPEDRPGANLTLVDLPEGEVTLPETEQVVGPKFPGGRSPDEEARGSRRQQLTIWLASRDNPYLARAAVNRLWALLFGRGLVEPVDDLGPHNPPSHPELMDELAEYFVETGFDVRELLRTLTATRAYQLSSQATGGQPGAETAGAETAGAETAGDESLFARMATKTLTAEQLYDSLSRLMGTEPGGTPANQSSSRLLDPRRQAFVARMQSPSRKATEFESGVPQALTMMNGSETSALTQAGRTGILAALEAPLFDDRQRVETLFLATLSRFPQVHEREQFGQYVSAAAGDDQGRRRALGDVLWALINSAEFALNH